ncbi:MAG TPA: phosphatase PAP2 family protein [Candidatus Paceibacterota bacterium]|jgi:undecaprenyl-diphosphatase
MGTIRIGAVSALLFVLFAGLLIYAPGVLARIDLAASTLVAPLQTLDVIEAFLVITVLGGGVGVIVVSVGAIYIGRFGTTEVLQLGTVLAGVLFANKVLKEVFVRARPETLLWLDPIPSFSFPSGHATAAIALYGFLAVLAYRRTQRLLIPALLVAVGILVGLSRIVLSAHYLSDVLAGFFLGTALVCLAFSMPVGRLVEKYG